MIILLYKVFNYIYETGHFPDSWLKSTFIPLPKTKNARKLLLKIIHKRIYHKCERNISDNQFGFKSGIGTREALFSLQVLIQNCRDMNKDR